MDRFYRCLLRLYPSSYRREFAEEMMSVFHDVHEAVRAEGRAERWAFRAREILGLFAGALQEHMRVLCGGYLLISCRRFDMRPRFRFPRSTVFLMCVILGVVILAIEKANTIELKYAGFTSTPSLPWFMGVMLVFTLATVLLVWGILFALGRTGMHRLAKLEPGAKRAD